MEKLPKHLENKIFYYLSHPITDLLKTQEVVFLYPHGIIVNRRLGIVYAKGSISMLEKGVYDCDWETQDRLPNYNRNYIISLRVYKYRVIRKYLQIGTIKHKKMVKIV